MSKILFTVQYEIKNEAREEYLHSVHEMKSLISTEGLEAYHIYEVKGKTNQFEEVYVFSSEEAYENFDDAANERVNILLSKIENLKVHNSTRYTTLSEIA